MVSLAWAGKDQDLKPWVDAAHDAGCKVSFMAADVEDAVRGAEAGADVIVKRLVPGLGGRVVWGWLGCGVGWFGVGWFGGHRGAIQWLVVDEPFLFGAVDGF